MKCVTPLLLDGEYVPCGHCYACQTIRRNEWDLRLRVQFMNSEYAAFVTLTYEDRYLPYMGIVSIDDHQKFIGTLRSKARDVKFRYYCVGEYGETFGRPHMHYLLFFDKDIDIVRLVNESWPFGFTDVGDVTNKSIHYVTKWHINPKNRIGESREIHGFSKMSKGVGADLLDQLTVKNIRPTYCLDGKRLPVSRYYRKKLGFVVADCESLVEYIARRYDCENLLQVNAVIKRLKDSFEKIQNNPRKSIF